MDRYQNPLLTPADRARNKGAPLELDDWEQDAYLLLLKHHNLIAKLVGD